MGLLPAEQYTRQDVEQRVQWPMSNLDELGDDLYVVQQAPDIEGGSFNPVCLIRAVNGLQRLGERRALDIMRAYVEAATANPERRRRHDMNEQRVFLVARVLFIPINGNSEMPPLLIGAPSPLPPDAVKRQPLFPIVMLSQIPVLTVSSYGWMLGGHPQSPLEHLRFCAERCRLRLDPLVPETTAVGAVQSEPLRSQPVWQPCRTLLRQQALRAMAPAYTVSEEELRASDAEWPRHLRRIAGLRPEWNQQAQEFVATARG